ncbi:NB-ARC and ankyrin domain protein [Pochonia chlamydosporia 170]|uniref:NB-ARC and ankyrin domain protein n=1 Tax=Pochonia chlamydosporia 170 TaxID=1380566 RepID=A0A219AT53_METCM|nr:NB-ARC and ankyrin domain protein [Pochonia chlamydosporia 170]OWT43365.1 NB-ARC and ankyrin domain protein [Pochonia chlamydosporia 170]
MQKRDLGPEIDQEAIPGSEKRRKIDLDEAQILTVRTALKRLPPDAYTVGWICAIAKELVAAKEFLDELHQRPRYSATHDCNDYTFGRVGRHNVVVAILGEYGTASAACVARDMCRSFPTLRFCLMVGIGGGAPSPRHDIRLGDVVVSTPRDGHGGVLQYDFGKTIQDHSFRITASLNQPPVVLQRVVNGLKAQYESYGNCLKEAISNILNKNPRLQREYKRPNSGSDRLYKSTVVHPPKETSCAVACGDDPSKLIKRDKRTEGVDNPVIHYGLIASANQVMKDALVRDALAAEKDVLCFEMESAGLMNHFACLVIRGICDYSDSHKSKEWQGYAAMAAAAYAKDLLCRMPPSEVEAEEKMVGEDNQLLPDEQKKELLDSLRFDQIEARHMTIRKAHAKTCSWLLEDPSYLDWLDPTKLSEHAGFLWIKGNPGTGKSTLMKFALNNARKVLKDKIIIAFFFNARGEDLERSTLGMYRSILLQLLEQVQVLQEVFSSLGLATWSAKSHHWSVESLKELFEQAIRRLGRSPVLCFIDALDECDERQIRDMVAFFEHISEATASGGLRFQVCFASRHYPHITIANGLSLVLEGHKGHSRDIICYIDSELKIGRSQLAEQIRVDVQQKSSGVFLWVILVVEILNKEYDRGRVHALRTRLQDIPRGLHELFHDILTRDHQNRGELLLCIQWVLFARLPLRPEQLYFAILSGVEPKALSKWNPDGITASIIKRYIIDSSKGLAEVTRSKNPRVQFIHESVKDFLLKENGLKEIWLNLGRNFHGESHERLKQCCLNYMSINVYTDLNIGSLLPNAASQQAAELRQLADKAFPFLEYAVRNILYHADAAEGDGVDQTAFLEGFQLVDWIHLDNLLERHNVRRHTLKASMLYLLAEYNMGNLIRSHPSKLSCFKVEGERYGLPIFAALATNSDAAVREFLQAQTDIQPPTSPLHAFYEQYYRNKNRRSDFRRDFTFSQQRSILSYLAEKADDAVFVSFLLVSDKVNIDVKDNNGRTPLSCAAQFGREAVVKMLLKMGTVDINAKDKRGETPLLLAAQSGHNAVVKLLLETGKVDINAKGTNGQTPLLRAAQDGHEAVVKLLLETGKVDINAKDINGQTPLLRAAQSGHEAVVKLLLETDKVDINAKDINGQTPLLPAARNGHMAAVKLLLETGKVVVDLKDNSLLWAAEMGHEAVVKLLLDTGTVDINAKDKSGETPLLLAAEHGHEAVVKLLLETGTVDINARSKSGRTPLLLATENGHEAVVKLLLETGKVVVDLKDNFGWTPLLLAAEMGHEAVVKLLLDTGTVDINATDKSGETPLLLAAQSGHDAVVKLLLETGKVVVDLKDNSGRTPLLWAAEMGHVGVVKLLLETGKVVVDLKDNYGRTPLWWGLQEGYEAIVELLQQKSSNEDGLPDALRSTGQLRG